MFNCCVNASYIHYFNANEDCLFKFNVLPFVYFSFSLIEDIDDYVYSLTNVSGNLRRVENAGSWILIIIKSFSIDCENCC